MLDWIVLRKLLAGLVLPPGGLLLCAVLGLALRGRYRVLGAALAWAAVLALLLLSIPIVSAWLVLRVSDAPALDLAQPQTAQAIVILGGGIRHDAPDFKRDTLGLLTLERVRYGAYLARKTGLPILVTGGVLTESEPEAVLMKDALENEFQVPVRWAETRARNTHQNAQYSAEVLRADRIVHVLLVTHAFDTLRAGAELRSAGLEVTVAPTGMGLGRPDDEVIVADFIPSARALLVSYFACYELAAIALMRF